MYRITVSEPARPTTEVDSMRSGNAARPVIARSAIATSMITMPSTIPTTAFRAALSSLAEKNFWYMPLSPRMSRKVGAATPNTHRTLWPPSGSRWLCGRAFITACTPPSSNTM